MNFFTFLNAFNADAGGLLKKVLFVIRANDSNICKVCLQKTLLLLIPFPSNILENF
jgi:hypothetical protein